MTDSLEKGLENRSLSEISTRRNTFLKLIGTSVERFSVENDEGMMYYFNSSSLQLKTNLIDELSLRSVT